MEEKRMEKIWRFLKDEEGTELVEWGLVAALLLAVAATVFTSIGTAVSEALTAVLNLF